MGNKTYDTLKWITLILLPALGALYFALSEIWGFPHTEEVIGSIAVVTTFLGVLLGFSTRRYNKGDSKYDGAFVVDTTDPERDSFRFEIDNTLEGMALKDEITLQVKRS